MTTEEIDLLPRISLFIGENKPLAVTARDTERRRPIDLTGSTVYFMGKVNLEDADADAILDETISSFEEPTLGKVQVPVDLTSLPDELKNGESFIYCDLIIKDSAGSVENHGIFIIELNKAVRDNPV
jgi:hypothetical protein